MRRTSARSALRCPPHSGQRKWYLPSYGICRGSCPRSSGNGLEVCETTAARRWLPLRKSYMPTDFPIRREMSAKKQLHILHMEFTICGEVIDEYGDVCCESLCFTLDRKEHTVTLHRENRTMQITLTEKDMRKLLNVIVNNYEVFCWEDDYGFPATADTDDLWEDEWEAESSDAQKAPEEPAYEDFPSWKVSVRYTNGEAQEMCGYDDLPDRVNELALELLALFEDEPDMENESHSKFEPDVR